MPKKRRESDLDIRIRARANLAYAEAGRRTGEDYDDVVLEAFMATFHPELQRDRAYMRELKEATRKEKR